MFSMLCSPRSRVDSARRRPPGSTRVKRLTSPKTTSRANQPSQGAERRLVIGEGREDVDVIVGQRGQQHVVRMVEHELGAVVGLADHVLVAFKDHFAAVAEAMRAGVHAILLLGPERGALRISAGNYGGKLGPHHYYLKDLLP